MVDLSVFPQFLLNGLVYGGLIAVGAMSLTLVFDVLDFINFAHGEYFTLGAYIGYVLNVWLGLAIWWAFLLTLPIMAVFSIAVDRVVFKPMRGANHIVLLIVSIGLSFVLRNVIRIIWGVNGLSYQSPFTPGWNLFGIVNITLEMVAIIITAILIMLSVHFGLTRTMLGKKMRAVSDDKRLASASGIHTERISIWAWGIGGALAGAAGVLLGLQNVIDPMLGFSVLLAVFGAVVLGGIGDIYGALFGGFAIGLLQKLSVAFFPSSYQIAIVFFVLVVVFLYKPQGVLSLSRSSTT